MADRSDLFWPAAVGFFDSSGNPAAKGTLTILDTGSATLSTIHQDALKVNTATNPVTLNDSGRAFVYVNDVVDYKVVDASGNIIVDLVVGVQLTRLNNIASGTFALSTDLTAKRDFDRMKYDLAELLYESATDISVRFPQNVGDGDNWSNVTGLDFATNLDTGGEAASTWYAVHLNNTLAGASPVAADFVISLTTNLASKTRFGCVIYPSEVLAKWRRGLHINHVFVRHMSDNLLMFFVCTPNIPVVCHMR